MKEILNALVEALREQAIALQEVADQVMVLKETLAKRNSELAGELKKQVDMVAMQTVADRVTTLQQTLARHNNGLAGALKTQAEADREKSRANVYELQVNVARVKEAIAQLSGAGATPGRVSESKRAEAAPRKATKKAARRRV